MSKYQKGLNTRLEILEKARKILNEDNELIQNYIDSLDLDFNKTTYGFWYGGRQPFKHRDDYLRDDRDFQ